MKIYLILIALVFPILAYSDPTTRVDRARELLSIIEKNKIDLAVSRSKSEAYHKIHTEVRLRNHEEAKHLADIALKGFKEELHECALSSNDDDVWRITRTFTEEEVEELIVLYTSPLGKKLHNEGVFLNKYHIGYSEKLKIALAKLDERVLEILDKRVEQSNGSNS